MNNKKQKMPQFVKFAIFTTITVVFWVVFEVYRAITLKPDPIVPPAVLRQINPELDSFALEKLQNRVYIPESDIADTIITVIEEEEVAVEDTLNLDEDEILIEDEI